MRDEMLKSVLVKPVPEPLIRSIDIDASAVISTDGLSIASLLSAVMDDNRVGAGGYVLLIHAGHHAVFAVISHPEAMLGLVFLDGTRTALEIADIL
jgi:predicted regulator of Ras-like GTPase activity (Roadblock/LC7/MglB family)